MRSQFELSFVIALMLLYAVASGQSKILQEGQDFTSTHIELSANKNIKYSYIDQLGYLWFSTHAMTYRYDGSQIVEINKNNGYSSFDKDADLILEDKNNNKYFIYQEFEQFGLMKSGAFNITGISLPEGYTVYSADLFENQLYLLVKEPSGYKVILYQNNEFEEILDYPSTGNNVSPKILINKKYIFLLINNRLVIIQKADHAKKEFTIASNQRKFLDSKQILMRADDNNIIFTSPYSGRVFRVRSEDNFNNISELDLGSTDNDIINGIWKDNDNRLIITWKDMEGFIDRIILADHINKLHITALKITDRTLTSIAGLHFDQEIIIGSYYGLKVINRYLPQFTRHLSIFEEEGNYLESGISMRGFAIIDDQLYAAREIDNLLQYNTDKKEFLPEYLHQGSDTLRLRCTNSIINYEKDLWLSSCSRSDINYLIQYNVDNKEYNIYNPPGRIQHMVLDTLNDGIYLLTSRENETSKLVYFDIKAESFKMIPLNSDLNQGIKFSYIHLYDDYILIGSYNGLYVKPVGEQDTPGDLIQLEETFKNRHINFISTEDDLLTIGTMENGLYFYHIATGETTHFTTSTGLSSNAICGVLPDNKGNYWVSTYHGLHVIDQYKNVSYSFFEKDGINQNEFNRFSFFKKGDKMYFGGINGILEVDLNKFNTKTLSNPSFLISSISYYDEKVKGQIDQHFNGDIDKIVLQPYQENLFIKFKPISSINILSPIRVRIKNKAEEWHTLGTDLTYQFPYFTPGKYLLEVKQKNQGTEWYSSETVSIPVIYENYFYEAISFKILVIFSILSAIYFYIKKSIIQVREMEVMRGQIASDLHDSLGSLLTGMASKAEVALQKNPSNQNYNQFIKDSNQALEIMRDAIWSINPENDTLRNLIDRMKDFAFNMLNHKDIPVQYDINIIKDTRINPLWKREFYLIFKEAITNILKHAEPSTVKIKLHQDRKYIRMDITNDGVSNLEQLTKNNLNGLGMGLKTMLNRAKKLDGSMKYQKINGDQFNIEICAQL